MCVGHIASSARANRHHRGSVVARADEDQPVTKDRTRDDRVPLAVTRPPDLAPRFRIVGKDRTTARADDLLLTVNRDEQWRAEREFLLSRRFTSRLPANLSRALVQRHDERLTEAV